MSRGFDTAKDCDAGGRCDSRRLPQVLHLKSPLRNQPGEVEVLISKRCLPRAPCPTVAPPRRTFTVGPRRQPTVAPGRVFVAAPRRVFTVAPRRVITVAPRHVPRPAAGPAPWSACSAVATRIGTVAAAAQAGLLRRLGSAPARAAAQGPSTA